MPFLGSRTGLITREKGDDLGIHVLEPEQAVGIALGIVAFLALLLFSCCYWKRGSRFCLSRRKREAGTALKDERNMSQTDPEMQRLSSDARNHQQENMTAKALPRKPSASGSSQLYMDDKVELPVPDGLRHEIDGVGRSAAMAPEKVEIDGTPVGPVELPAEPAAPRQSWRTSTTTLFQYTPRPSYIVHEDEEGPDPDAVSPLSPTGPQQVESSDSNGSKKELSQSTPEATKPLRSLGDVLEAEPEERDTTKEVLSQQEEEVMLKRNSWNVWRNWGGGAGANGAS